MRLVTRLLLAVALVGAVVGMGVHYDTAEDDRWPYPTDDEVGADYDRHVGERAVLFGTVESVSERTARLTVEYGGGSFPLTVRGFEAAVEPGGTVQVLGTLESGGAMAADRVAVVNSSGGSLLYKYGSSLVGAALVLAVFFRHWTVGRTGFALRGDDG